jgi:hypothetical protein
MWEGLAADGHVRLQMHMTAPACLTHWYTSLLYVVPVVTVGGWGWWSARRISRNQDPPSPPSSASPSTTRLSSGATSRQA